MASHSLLDVTFALSPKNLWHVSGVFQLTGVLFLESLVRARTIAWCLAFVLFGSEAATAGYYLEHEALVPHPQSNRNIRVTLRSWLQDGKLKRRTPLQDATVIVDLNERVVTGIDERQDTFWRLSAEVYRSQAESSLLVFGLAPTSDGGVEVPSQLFVKTGKHAEIAGRQAAEYRVQGKFPAGVQTHIWVSGEVPLTAATWSQQMKMLLGAPVHPSYQNLFRQMAALPGYPVQTITTVRTQQGTALSSETLLVVREENIPADAFDVPAGFRRVPDPFSVMEQKKPTRKKAAPVGIEAPL